MARNSKQQASQTPALPKGFTTQSGIVVSVVNSDFGPSLLLVQKVRIASQSSNPLAKIKGIEQRRSCFLRIPKGVKPEEAISFLKRDKDFQSANIGRVISFEPIITDELQFAIDEGLTSYDDIADKQMVMRYGQDGTLEPATWHGAVYYALDKLGIEDQDLRH